VEELEPEAFQIIAPMEFVVNAAIFLGSESINFLVILVVLRPVTLCRVSEDVPVFGFGCGLTNS
jgi:hypothetical protein